MKMDALNISVLVLSTTLSLLRFSAADNAPPQCHDGASRCLEGWSQLSTGECWKIMDDKKDYDDAKKRCKGVGADLPDITMTEVFSCLKRNGSLKLVWLLDDLDPVYRKLFNLSSSKTENIHKEQYYHYACVINKEYKHLSTTLNIQSNGRDVWRSASDEKLFYITPRQPYTLICESQEAAPAMLNLIKNGINVATRTLSSSNKIVYNITGTDECSGQRVNFTCKAENLIESVNSSVVIMCPSKIVLFTTSTTSDISDDKSKEGSYYVGNNISLTCTAEGHLAPEVVIRGKKDNSVIGLGTGSSVVTLDKVDCDDMGTYICETRQGEIRQDLQEISLGIHGCSPRLCHSKNEGMTRSTLELDTTDQRKIFSLCVLAYPQLNDTASFNGRMIPRGHSHPHFTWDYRNNDEFSSNYTVTFTIQNMTSNERLNITLFTSEGEKLELNYSSLLKETTAHPIVTTTSKNGVQDASSSIPLGGLIALVVVITVMVVVAFFILGIFIFRYRRKYILRKRPQSESTLRSYHSEPANHYQNKDEMELYSTATVNVYANLGHAGNQSRESRFMDAPRDRYQPTGLAPAETAKDNTYQNARAFSVSTTCLNTSVNVYANTRDIARMRERGERPHSVPEQERLCPENGDTLYGNTEPGGNADDTGRHRTHDGLLYVTVAHTVHSGSNGGGRRPAQSEDPAVHYAVLDYKKTGTHSAKKWKRKKWFSFFKYRSVL